MGSYDRCNIERTTEAKATPQCVSGSAGDAQNFIHQTPVTPDRSFPRRTMRGSASSKFKQICRYCCPKHHHRRQKNSTTRSPASTQPLGKVRHADNNSAGTARAKPKWCHGTKHKTTNRPQRAWSTPKTSLASKIDMANKRKHSWQKSVISLVRALKSSYQVLLFQTK